jgi:glycosyltransferase involved in cell wall biosynthesis
MKIGLDLAPLSEFRGGITVFLRGLLEELVKPEHGLELIGYLHNDADPALDGLTIRRGKGISRGIRQVWMQSEGRRLAREDELDLFWATLYQVPRGFPGKIPIITTVYDVMWKVLPETMRKRTRFHLDMVAPRAIRSAQTILAISEATARDVDRFFQRKAIAVHPGVRPEYTPRPGNRGREIVGEDRYALFVGTLEPRKNLERVLQAWQAVPEAPPLAIVNSAPGWKNSAIFQGISTTLQDRVRHVGKVPGKDLPELYSGAEFFTYPSLYEGFGLPVIEAMACGCPVITSSVSSLPEVAGNAALLVDPNSVEEIAEGIRELSTNPGSRSELRGKGLIQAGKFSWKKSAAEYARIFRETAAAFQKSE